MTAPEPRSPRRNALLETLCERFAVFRDARPLALGVHKVILERLPEIDAGKLRLAMRLHTASTRYLKAIAGGRERFDLDANVAGEITDEQREVAATTLRERFKDAAERRQAEAKAERERAALAQRQEKLEQLAARFGRR